MAKMVTLIHTSEVQGRGTDESPTHILYELWTMDGRLVASWSPSLQAGKVTEAVVTPEPHDWEPLSP